MRQWSVGRVMLSVAVVMATTVTSAGQTFTLTNTSVQEAIGDPGGTNFGNAPNSTAGQGLPTTLGGWPNGAGFAADPSFGNNTGISGFKNDGAALTVNLSAAQQIRFTWVGKGDSTLLNSFQVDTGSGFQTLWGPASPPSGGIAYPPTGPVSYVLSMPAGPILFRWITGGAVTIANGQSVDLASSPGFFAGVDPYLATGTFQTSGDAVYLGLTDLAGAGDHDFQDLGVRVTGVPEPASLLLLGSVSVGLAGYRVVRRRRKRRVCVR